MVQLLERQQLFSKNKKQQQKKTSQRTEKGMKRTYLNVNHSYYYEVGALEDLTESRSRENWALEPSLM